MQGFNMGRYHPPSSLDPALSSSKTGGFNSQGHPLGARAKKLASEGALIVRFEMPFRIWCETCSPESIIDQGVRFNAEKKKVGKYYSSPIWQFRMKHTACGGFIEIRTDPQSSKYVVTEGGRMRDFGIEDSTHGHFGEILTEEERERRRNDAMAALEGKVKEKAVVKSEGKLVEELLAQRDKHWDDVYTANQRLRRIARVERKAAAVLQKDREAVADRMGLSIEILNVTQEDKDRAALVEFGSADRKGELSIARTTQKPLFESSIKKASRLQTGSHFKSTKAELKAERSKALFQEELEHNTRATVDPFLSGLYATMRPNSSSSMMAGTKRKRLNVEGNVLKPRDDTTSDQTQSKLATSSAQSVHMSPLVGYESEEE